MDDMISRQAARYNMIENMLSIQPEQKTGRWIPFDCDTWECSECKDVFILLEGTPKDNNYNYFPNCGARMLGEVIQ